MKYFYLLPLLLLTQLATYAQLPNFGFVTHEDMQAKRSLIDSNANAEVQLEYGTARMNFDDNTGSLYIDYEYQAQIKIFNKKGFEHGNIAIYKHIYKDGDMDKLTDVKAVTINYVNNEFVRHELDNSKIFNEKLNKYTSVSKFTLPNLQEGSIVQYSYKLRINYIFNFKTWDFQSDIPKVSSKYVAFIPGLYNYNVVLRGPLKLSSSNGVVANGCMRINGRDINCSKMTYVMDNVPAFIEEDYMTAASNFRAAMYFELSDYMLLDGSKRNVTKTWKDIEYELVKDNRFGSQMKKKDAFKELMPSILKGSTDELGKAKAVYRYISSNIKSNGFIGIYSETVVKKALESHSGNTGDINLALISALTAADLDAEAVVLSTRKNGAINTLFPVLSDFDYVVAKVNIGDKSFLLDASTPMMPFGLLPLHCINGQGRVISLKKPSYWIDLLSSEKDYTRNNMTAKLGDDGKIRGELITYSSGYSGVDKRKAIQKAGSIDEFVEKLDEQKPQYRILAHEIENLDSLDLPLIERYTIEMLGYESMAHPQLFLNPFFMDKIEKNPFNLDERTYPIDLGTAKESRLTMILEVPESFELKDQPRNLNISLANAGGRYLSSTAFEDHKISFSQLLQLSKPIYAPEEYLSLKEFFSRIIQVQKTDILLKKSGK
ncbi:hypothetical protein PBAL39_01097 [Pedobacter sp. BAL39]|uniref:DUF3857 domain-containing protein n=1 Tax=Pedobacter sp. BAL39 TaxID=391596 RepID=UPI000155A1A6|nr:DUF3857 domain-containing protein [Pedobacter sp. BAL39]EDM38168.1 hypothetical protein PBAL39_01097 [Pedobacter sp. BAL39]